MRTRYHAYCYASGEIEIGITTPDGAIEIATGPACGLREEVEVVARHAYDNVALLVPGVPEACSFEEKQEALIRFVDWARSGSRHAAWRTGEQVKADIEAMESH